MKIEWIPVSERLPEKSGNVLVWSDSHIPDKKVGGAYFVPTPSGTTPSTPTTLPTMLRTPSRTWCSGQRFLNRRKDGVRPYESS